MSDFGAMIATAVQILRDREVVFALKLYFNSYANLKIAIAIFFIQVKVSPLLFFFFLLVDVARITAAVFGFI